MKNKIKENSGISTRHKPYVIGKASTSGITLIALIVTIVVLIILAVISVNLLMTGNIIGRAEQSKEIYQVAQIREELSLVLGDAGIEKVLNKKYNENEFLDEFILKQEPDVEILDNIIIKDGHAFELDRSVPKLGEYTGKKEDLAIPELEVTTVVADDYRTATITINAKEEENGISKIEIIQAGFVIKEYTYDNEKGPITEKFVAKQNGKYIVKVYSELNVSKMTEVSGLVATIKYSPNGDETYKKAHSVKITVDDSIDKVKSIKYQWLQTTKEPAANTFVDSCNNGGTITKDGLNGSWYLWTLLETESEKTNIGRSEVFNFDNEGPTVSVTPTPLTEKSFKLRATATDTHIGQISKYDFYVNGVLKDTLKYKEEGTELEVTLPGAAENVECKVVGYDSLDNPKEITVLARTKLYTWSCYEVQKNIYYECVESSGHTTELLSKNSDYYAKNKAFLTFSRENGVFELLKPTLTTNSVLKPDDIIIPSDDFENIKKWTTVMRVENVEEFTKGWDSWTRIYFTELRSKEVEDIKPGNFVREYFSINQNEHKPGYDGKSSWYSDCYLS